MIYICIFYFNKRNVIQKEQKKLKKKTKKDKKYTTNKQQKNKRAIHRYLISETSSLRV